MLTSAIFARNCARCSSVISPGPPAGIAFAHLGSAAARSGESGGLILTYPSKATACTTPPFFLIAISSSSSRFRLWLATARADECDAMTGAFDSAMACRFDCFDGCERSIMNPTRFISAMACLPRSLSPLCSHLPSRSPVFESANWLWPLCASDR